MADPPGAGVRARKASPSPGGLIGHRQHSGPEGLGIESEKQRRGHHWPGARARTLRLHPEHVVWL